jgi:hypothetical protein
VEARFHRRPSGRPRRPTAAAARREKSRWREGHGSRKPFQTAHSPRVSRGCGRMHLGIVVPCARCRQACGNSAVAIGQVRPLRTRGRSAAAESSRPDWAP